jgi:hypothetical protein
MSEVRILALGTKGPARAASVAAVTTAVGAVACGVCCVLPFALPAVAAAGTGSMVPWFARAYGAATTLASVMVAGAWIAVGLQSRRARMKPSRPKLCAMTLANWSIGVGPHLAAHRAVADSHRRWALFVFASAAAAIRRSRRASQDP